MCLKLENFIVFERLGLLLLLVWREMIRGYIAREIHIVEIGTVLGLASSSINKVTHMFERLTASLDCSYLMIAGDLPPDTGASRQHLRLTTEKCE